MELLEKHKIMANAAIFAADTSSRGIGGPFGAAIVKDGQVICIASNRVIEDNDPTAHAEITAIREACKILNTYDLTGCELYATGYPCPMCLSAIIWANIKKVYYCNSSSEAAKIGFRDDFIYDYLRGNLNESNVIDLEICEVAEGKKLYADYADNNKIIY